LKWCVSIRLAAETDVAEAREWYESQRAGLGDEFLASVAQALMRLEESPEQFPVYYKDFRRVLTERFPYKVFFRVEGEAVIVFRVLHAARDHTWRLR
jgi:plasmid stabilization system protein ParE